MLARHSRKGCPWIISAAIALLLMAALGGAAQAQQGSSPPPEMISPHSQGGGAGVLELPRAPGTQGEPSNLRPLVPQPGQELEIPPRQLRSQAGYAQVTVTVNDPSGSYVTGLNKDDFKLFVDGEQRPIEFFRHDTRAPVSIGILVDVSGSMHPKLPRARAAIAEFLRDLNPHDEVFLVAFNDRPFMLQYFTTDRSLMMSRLGLLHADGRTALYDVIVDGLQTVERGRYDKKALLVVTDGMDTASRMFSSVSQVVEEARRRGVLVYSIGIGDPNASASPFGIMIGPLVLGGGDEEAVDAKTLQTLSRETGAKTFIVSTSQARDGDALRLACEQISLELREQYTVGFLAPDGARGGYRTVNVEVPAHPDMNVRVRKGVTVGHGTSEAALDPDGRPDSDSARPAYP